MKYRLKIKRNGTIEFLGNPPPGWTLPVGEKERFSEIVPVHPIKRAAFRVLRWMFGEEGRVSDWTRRWAGPWEGIILMGPARGLRNQSNDRQSLITWETVLWRYANERNRP